MFAIQGEESFIPGLSRSSSERSSSSTGSNVCSKNLSYSAVSSGAPLSKPEGRHNYSCTAAMWPESSALDLDLETDRPLWDLDPKDPSCAWNLDLSQQLAAKLLMAGGGEDPGFNAGPDQQPPLLGSLGTAVMSDTTNPYALLNQIQDTSVHMNTTATAEGASGTANPRFKTEICRNFKEKGTCLYGELCQFAHGKHELRKDVVRHNKYKTKHCQKYWIQGYCAYGPRCNFIHKEQESQQRLGGMTGATNTLARPGTMPAAMFKTAAQVFGFANMRKVSLGETGESSGSDDGRSGSRVAKYTDYVRPSAFDMAGGGMDGGVGGLDKFPTFYPRAGPGGMGVAATWGGAAVGPVGSGRPDRSGRVVWPGA